MKYLHCLLVGVLLALSGCANTPQALDNTEYCFDTADKARAVGANLYSKLMAPLQGKFVTLQGIGVMYGKLSNSRCAQGQGSVQFVYQPRANNPLDVQSQKALYSLGLETFNRLMNSSGSGYVSVVK